MATNKFTSYLKNLLRMDAKLEHSLFVIGCFLVLLSLSLWMIVQSVICFVDWLTDKT